MKRLRILATTLMIGGAAALTGCHATSKSACASGCGCSSTKATTATFELPTTPAQQSDATPDSVLKQLMAGNARYVAGERTAIDIKNSRKAATQGQYPLAYVLSCVDSRVPVEVVFDQGIGDIFVGRVAGNFENTDQLGSMEFATAAAGSKLVMVLGHEGCGAIKGSIDDVKLGNLTSLLGELKPAVNAVPGHDGQRTSKNGAFVNKVIEANVKQTVSDLRQRSKVLADLEKQGKIKIVGAVYSLQTGEVTLVN
ncbi:MAG: carbonic anhydrase family protein [Phycisphaeraceae bacterium]